MVKSEFQIPKTWNHRNELKWTKLHFILKTVMIVYSSKQSKQK